MKVMPAEENIQPLGNYKILVVGGVNTEIANRKLQKYGLAVEWFNPFEESPHILKNKRNRADVIILLQDFMEGIEELPSGIEKQGAEKVANWLTKKTGVEVIAEGENLLVPSLSELDVEIPEQAFNSDLITTFGVTDCIIAVGLMIGTVGFPLSKITKLKKAIDFLGGVNKTVNRIYKSYKKYKSWNYRTKDAWKAAVNESAKGLPQDTLNAFLDFFNISNVVNNCT